MPYSNYFKSFFTLLLSVFVCGSLTFQLLSQSAAAQNTTKLSHAQLQAIGQKIYFNETGANPDYLVAWNSGEAFASLGIGHFIWFPENSSSPFTETFPGLVDYLHAHDVPLPTWLLENRDCPWQSKQDYEESANSIEMQQLKHLMSSSFEHQVAFIHQRMQKSLPLILAKLDDTDNKQFVKDRFNALAATELGMYSLIDYVNFKGEGIAESETYQGQGWGLLHVLLNMNPQASSVNTAFSHACDFVLTRRVNNSTQQNVETKWLAGWRKRCASYAQ